MKTIFKKYTFAALSITAICMFFIFTGGGVYDGNGTALDPPSISFVSGPGTGSVGTANTFIWRVGHGTNPTTYQITESCDAVPNYPDKVFSRPNLTPEVKIELKKDGNVVYTAPSNTISAGIQASIAPQGLQTPFTWTNSGFSHPGVYQVVCSARAVSKTPQVFKNGVFVSGGGDVFSAWTTDVRTITITGTAPLSIRRYTFTALLISPANGDPSPLKSWTFSDPNNQYVEIVNEGTINLKFKWTPPAGDTLLYPNLASKYDFSYTNASYSVTNASGSFVPGYNIEANLRLNFQGQSIDYDVVNYPPNPNKFLAFYRPSKKIAGGKDYILIQLDQ